jgi:uncharacterized protein (TIGR02246 family)
MGFRLLILGVALLGTIGFALMASDRAVNPSQASGDDEQRVRAMVDDTIARLNRGDTTAVVDYWDEAADYVGVDGRLITGRDQIQAFFATMSSSTNRPQQTATIERIRLLTPDVAIVDGSWTITGARDTAGKELPPINGRGTEVVRRTNGKWRFVATREMVIWKPT